MAKERNLTRANRPHLAAPTGTDESLAEFQIGETLGSFMGFLRRAKPSKQGLTAQIFGENGTDADFISVLHLTRFLDAPMKVSVWLVKDSKGRMFDQEGRQQPLLAEFIACNRRPTASEMGQTAMFFGENGPNADAINKLNESRYLDSLVLVELQKAAPGMAAVDIRTQTPSEELEAGKARLTGEEEATLKRQQKRADEAMTELRRAGFFTNETVLRALGSEADYRQWLASQTCCTPEESHQICQRGPVQAFPVTNLRMRQFSLVPMCLHHKQDWESETPPVVGAKGGSAFLIQETHKFAARWAQERLRKALNVPDGFLPSPGLVFAWAAEHQLRAHLPPVFTHFLDQA